MSGCFKRVHKSKKGKSVKVIRVINKNTNYLNFDPDVFDVNRTKNQQD